MASNLMPVMCESDVFRLIKTTTHWCWQECASQVGLSRSFSSSFWHSLWRCWSISIGPSILRASFGDWQHCPCPLVSLMASTLVSWWDWLPQVCRNLAAEWSHPHGVLSQYQSFKGTFQLFLDWEKTTCRLWEALHRCLENLRITS